MIFFDIERELTDEEMAHLQGVAQNIIDKGDAEEACDALDISVKGWSPAAVMEQIVQTDKDKKYGITLLWPTYVRMFLKTENWQLGYGYVGRSR